MRCVLFLFVLLLMAEPRVAVADCVVSGEGLVEHVVPRGTHLDLRVREEMRVTLEGRRAHVLGITPIAFEGNALARGVQLSLRQRQHVQGVLTVEAGVPLSVVQATGDRATVRFEAGATRFASTLRCSDLSLVPHAVAEAEEVERTPTYEVRPNAQTLVVFAGAQGTRGLSLRDRAPRERSAERGGGWPDFEVLGASGTRLHLRATLEVGIVLDGWVERTNVRRVPEDESISACGCDPAGSFGCGHGYLGETYRGPARLLAGSALLDGAQVVWGHVVVDVDVVVVGTAISVRSSIRVLSAPMETVWLERMGNVLGDPCSGLGVHVARDAVVLPAA